MNEDKLYVRAGPGVATFFAPDGREVALVRTEGGRCVEVLSCEAGMVIAIPPPDRSLCLRREGDA